MSQLVTASYFGASNFMDAYLAASVVPQYFTTVLLGSLGFVFIPIFIYYKAKERDSEAWEIASTFINLLFSILVILTIIGLFLSDYIISITAPGLSIETHEMAVYIFKILWPGIIATGLNTLSIGIYQSYSKFTWSSAVPVLGGLISLLLMLVLINKYGINGLAIASIVSLFLQTILLAPILIKPGNYRPVIKLMNPGVKQILHLYFPLLIVSLFSKSTTLAERYFASGLPSGSISHLAYAFKIFLIGQTLISTGIATTAFPIMANHFAKDKIDLFRNTIKRSFTFMWVAIAPAIVIGIFIAFPFVTIVFQRGQFNAEDSKAVSQILKLFLFAIPAACFGTVTGKIFYIQKKTNILMIFGIIESVAYLIYTFFLSKHYGIVGIAIGYVIYFNVSLLWQLTYLWMKNSQINLKVFKIFINIGISACLGGATTLYIINHNTTPIFQLIFGALSGLTVYLISLFFFNLKVDNFWPRFPQRNL